MFRCHDKKSKFGGSKKITNTLATHHDGTRRRSNIPITLNDYYSTNVPSSFSPPSPRQIVHLRLLFLLLLSSPSTPFTFAPRPFLRPSSLYSEPDPNTPAEEGRKVSLSAATDAAEDKVRLGRSAWAPQRASASEEKRHLKRSDRTKSHSAS